MSDIAKKRQFVSDMYDGPKWKDRVSKMNDDQIIAIYLRAQEDANKPKKEKPVDPKAFFRKKPRKQKERNQDELPLEW